VCIVPLTLTADPGADRVKPSTQRPQSKGVKGAEVTSVNMHRLGESFKVVEKVAITAIPLTGLIDTSCKFTV
jgi:hypothetical protein